MSLYRRVYQPGGCYFFTVVTHARRPILLAPDTIDRLRHAFRKTMAAHPFDIDAIVILPDHLHCIWRLPADDQDYSGRWRAIKHHVSVATRGPANSRGEKQVWQRRFWEHLIRDEDDWRRHMDYIHFNPVKHGYALAPSEWPHGSFADAVKRGWYDPDWGKQEPASTQGMDCE